MDIKDVKRNWECLGRRDPLWAILNIPEKKGGRWEIDEFFETGQTEIDSIISALHRQGITKLGERALDFGCGVGRLTRALAQHFREVWGVDGAPSMIHLANQYNRYPEICTFHINDQENLRFVQDGYFNFVISLIVLQHMPPQHSTNYLKEFMRVLAPGGMLVFQLPSERNPRFVEPQIKRWLRNHVKPLVPLNVRKAFRLFREGDFLLELINMHAIPREVVVSFLYEAGGEVVEVKEDSRAGPPWISLEYLVRKRY